jgi:glyoxylase-like metal-dependent hydrolase (beta-lactamase superfamily II)
MRTYDAGQVFLMRVFPIGVGTAFGRRLFNTNSIFQFDNGEFLLVDCGFTASRSLETIGLSVLDVENLFISHLHADHIGGIEELVLNKKLKLGQKVNLFVNAKLADGLWQSIRGGLEFTQLGRLGLEDYFDVHSHVDGFDLQGINFSSHPTLHIEGMLSFDIGSGGFLLTGDTVFSRDYVVNRVQNFDTVVHDCSFNNHQKVHAYYEDLIANRDLFNDLYVIHYEDNIGEFEPTLTSAGIKICRQYNDIDFGGSQSCCQA